MSLNKFISEVKSKGLARTNRYAVILTPPVIMQSIALNSVLLFCDQVTLPGTNYSTVQNRTFGEFREVPYEKLYDSVTMNFYVDTDMNVKRMFDVWTNSISNPFTKTFNYYNNYITNMHIQVQDLNEGTKYVLTLYEAYPKTVNSIQLDYASKDVMKLAVTMQYKYWTADQTKEIAVQEGSAVLIRTDPSVVKMNNSILAAITTASPPVIKPNAVPFDGITQGSLEWGVG